MSYDIFFKGFIAGEASGLGGAQMREVLAPHVVSRRTDLSLDREFAQANE
jgi:hypothetical protein